MMLQHAALIKTLPVHLPEHHLLQKSWALALAQLSDLLFGFWPFKMWISKLAPYILYLLLLPNHKILTFYWKNQFSIFYISWQGEHILVKKVGRCERNSIWLFLVGIMLQETFHQLILMETTEWMISRSLVGHVMFSELNTEWSMICHRFPYSVTE